MARAAGADWVPAGRADRFLAVRSKPLLFSATKGCAPHPVDASRRNHPNDSKNHVDAHRAIISANSSCANGLGGRHCWSRGDHRSSYRSPALPCQVNVPSGGEFRRGGKGRLGSRVAGDRRIWPHLFVSIGQCRQGLHPHLRTQGSASKAVWNGEGAL